MKNPRTPSRFCGSLKVNFFQVCIPETVVDYRFSTVIDAIHLTHLDYPHLEFTKKLEKAKNKLEDGEVDCLF